MPITIPSAPIGELGAQWRACVGTGRLDLALRADYRESLALVPREIGFEREIAKRLDYWARLRAKRNES